MAKLTQAAAEAHHRACGLVALDRPLSADEQDYVLDNYQESATTINSMIGAYFTPWGLARDLADIHTLGLGVFDTAIGNAPYGAAGLTRRGPRYRGAHAEYCFLDVASDIAKHAVFIVPETSAPFRYGGRLNLEEQRATKYERFERATGIVLEMNCGLDTSPYRDEWRGVAPIVEIVTADLRDARERRGVELSLFA